MYWVPLAAVTDATEVCAAVATGVGLTGSLGARAVSVLINVLRDRRVLLVLDNCEQVVAGCQELLTQVLPACASAGGVSDEPDSSRVSWGGRLRHSGDGRRSAADRTFRERCNGAVLGAGAPSRTGLRADGEQCGNGRGDLRGPAWIAAGN